MKHQTKHTEHIILCKIVQVLQKFVAVCNELSFVVNMPAYLLNFMAEKKIKTTISQSQLFVSKLEIILQRLVYNTGNRIIFMSMCAYLSIIIKFPISNSVLIELFVLSFLFSFQFLFIVSIFDLNSDAAINLTNQRMQIQVHQHYLRIQRTQKILGIWMPFQKELLSILR